MSRKRNRGNWVGLEKDPLIPTQMNRMRQRAIKDDPDLGWNETVGGGSTTTSNYINPSPWLEKINGQYKVRRD